MTKFPIACDPFEIRPKTAIPNMSLFIEYILVQEYIALILLRQL